MYLYKGVICLQKRLLISISVYSSVLLLASNLAATKIFAFLGTIPMDAGILLFPLTYIIGDMSVEFFGERHARAIVVDSTIVNLFVMAVLAAVIWLPPFPGWENQEAYRAIFGFMPRVVAGSLLAFVVSNFVNIYVFAKIRVYAGEDKLFTRLFCSSVVAKVFDTLIFEFVAFFGVLAFKDFVLQAIVAYGAGLLLELLLSPISCGIIKVIKRRYTLR